MGSPGPRSWVAKCQYGLATMPRVQPLYCLALFGALECVFSNINDNFLTSQRALRVPEFWHPSPNSTLRIIRTTPLPSRRYSEQMLTPLIVRLNLPNGALSH